MTHGIDVDMEYDLSNVDFVKWIALKFINHSTMYWYMENTLWMYWIRRDDEENRVPYEIVDNYCIPFHFKNGHVDGRTCHSNDDGYCDGRDLIGMIQNENMVNFKDYEWYEGLKDGESKDKALMKKVEFEESQDLCSFDVEWEDFEQWFEVVKYPFRPAEGFVAIKECRYDDWMKNDEDACHV
nr:hypothetical protein [Tanacetum cinerariifolium]